MMKSHNLILGVILSLLWTGGLAAAEDDQFAEFRKKLTGLFSGQTPNEIAETPVEGLYEVALGPQIFYVSRDARYLVQGSIIDLESRTNITEPRKAQARTEAINQLGEENMVVFAPEKVKHTITVFTDIDCGYCRKLHQEIGDYKQLGIKVRYLMYPRAGVGSPAYNKAVTVWCSDDRQSALTRAKQGEKLLEKDCTNPVADQYLMGQLVGIQGTPAIITDQGELLPGYVPAKKLQLHLEAQKGGEG